MHAIHKHQVESVRALLDAGADVNGRSAKGDAPLMMAAGYGYVLGVPDMDRFTVGDCQLSTIRTLVQRVPDLRLKDSGKIQQALENAKIKGCAGVAMLNGERLP